MAEYAKIGGVWKKKDKEGNPYFSCSFKDKNYTLVLLNRSTGEKIKLEGASMFPNSYKKEDKHPDYIINAKISD